MTEVKQYPCLSEEHLVIQGGWQQTDAPGPCYVCNVDRAWCPTASLTWFKKMLVWGSTGIVYCLEDVASHRPLYAGLLLMPLSWVNMSVFSDLPANLRLSLFQHCSMAFGLRTFLSLAVLDCHYPSKSRFETTTSCNACPCSVILIRILLPLQGTPPWTHINNLEEDNKWWEAQWGNVHFSLKILSQSYMKASIHILYDQKGNNKKMKSLKLHEQI